MFFLSQRLETISSVKTVIRGGILMKKHFNRTMTIAIILLIGFVILIVRLADIQLVNTQSFGSEHVNLIKASIKQRTKGIILDDGRGKLLDRNGKPLYNQTRLSLILFPFLKNMNWPVNKVATIIQRNPQDLKSALSKENQPFAFDEQHLSLTNSEAKKINNLRIPGVFALPMKLSDVYSIAPHLIGLVKQNPSLVKSRYSDMLKSGAISTSSLIGISGLQKAYDPFLLSRDQKELLYNTTNEGFPLFGPNVKYSAPSNPYFPLNVSTTIDKKIQMAADRAVNQAGLKKGGVVILDAETSNLLAMVSRPKLNPNNPLSSGGKNLMLEPQFPGSVFKVVTASAAIEQNIVNPNEWFDCNLNMYGTGPAKRQLGSLNFSGSFAESCNLAFAQLGEKLTSSNSHILDKTAAKLGLTQKVGWTNDVYHLTNFQQIPNEKENTIWGSNTDRKVPKAMRQTAIGQLNVKLTPISVANMMATIARGGEKRMVRTATQVVHKDGTVVVTFPHKSMGGSQLSPYTIMQLQNLLQGVVANPNGTAHRLNHLPYTIAGKSGTAQTGKAHTNSWFAGYFPVDNPKYAMVVVNLDSHPGDNKTYDIYASIVKSLYKLDHQNQ